ncbi:hypothetical protein [Amycolatopsis sp. FDAARGOS 1241]|uniref:hypothetical protein n=1 Tax=Amycolatopsis sp. FDAARGOS 1241 TaxID=2778070 RepID=UPI001EF1A376|nr:hypothetical protein [Amycolatopsis sp. FDAARGOS 1241]
MADSIADGVKLKQDEEGFGHNAMEAAKKAPIVGKGVEGVSNAIDNYGDADSVGDFAGATGQMLKDGAGFVAGAAVDVASFALDPVNWLVSNGLNMLLELISPLQDALHFVTGDGPALKDAAGNFNEIGMGFIKLGEDFTEKGRDELKGWLGDGGDAARKALDQFSEGIKGIGYTTGGVGETLQMWSMVMTVIEEVVKAIISELVSWLIYIWLPALAASIVSLGSSVAGAMTASIAKAASAFTKITKHLGKLGELLQKFVNFLAKWSDNLIKEGSKLSPSGRGGMTPGAEKVVASAFAKESGTRGAATVDALADAAKAGGDEAVKQVVGVSPGDFGKGSGTNKKMGFDFVNKAIDNAKDIAKAGEAAESGYSSDKETRENLDMGG